MSETRKLQLLTGAFLLVHLALAAALPLVEDEAYYRLWSTGLAPGYYDHPPMVAWWIAAGTALAGQTEAGVRLVFVLAAALILPLAWRIAGLWAGGGARADRIAFRAALWTGALLPLSLGGIAATPDIPSTLFWTATVWALSEMLAPPGEGAAGHRARWWLAVGLFAGLGVLSKFTDLFLGVGLVLWLVGTGTGRRHLRTPWPWLGLGVAVLVLLPFLWWNLQHGWVGFQRQFGRLGQAPSYSPVRFLVFWAALALLLTPLLAWRAAGALRDPRVPPLFWWLAGPLTLYLAWHAFKVDAGAQWMMPAMPMLAVAAALAAPGGRLDRLVAPTGYGLAVLVLILGLWPGRPLLGLHGPFGQMRGWPAVRDEILARAQATGATWVATDAYGLTGQLSWVLRGRLPVRSATAPERYLFRPPPPARLCTEPALFISRRDPGPRNAPFAESTAQPPILRMSGATVLRRYHVALVRRPTPAATALACPR